MYHEWRLFKDSSIYRCKNCKCEVYSPIDKPINVDVVYIFNSFTDFLRAGTRTNIPVKCNEAIISLVMDE